jgi:hypothetical protein
MNAKPKLNWNKIKKKYLKDFLVLFQPVLKKYNSIKGHFKTKKLGWLFCFENYNCFVKNKKSSLNKDETFFDGIAEMISRHDKLFLDSFVQTVIIVQKKATIISKIDVVVI